MGSYESTGGVEAFLVYATNNAGKSWGQRGTMAMAIIILDQMSTLCVELRISRSGEDM